MLTISGLGLIRKCVNTCAIGDADDRTALFCTQFVREDLKGVIGHADDLVALARSQEVCKDLKWVR
jgi:hypothetical protein